MRLRIKNSICKICKICSLLKISVICEICGLKKPLRKSAKSAGEKLQQRHHIDGNEHGLPVVSEVFRIDEARSQNMFGEFITELIKRRV